MHASPDVVFDAASFAWPDGRVVLDSASATFSSRTGLIGRNGAGKSTLLKLITGELKPTSGQVKVRGEVGVLPQQLNLQTTTTVAALLGVAPKLAALRAIEAGSTVAEHYDLVGQDWDVEARAMAELGASGLGSVELDRPVGSLSGGEAVLVAVTGLKLARLPVTLLDEPTNNLDREAKAALLQLVAQWPGALLVVSHDPELLNVTDEIAELAAGRLSLFGGAYDSYVLRTEQQQAAVEQAVITASQKLRVEQRQRIEAETKLARSARRGRSDVANSKVTGIAADERRRRAQQTAGKVRGKLDDRVASAAAELAQAKAELRRQPEVSITLGDPDVAAGRRLFELHDGQRSFLVAGPKRVALTGRNGVGKTRLIESLFGHPSCLPLRAVAHTDRIGYLPQRLVGLDGAATVLETVAAVSTGSSSSEIRHRLAGLGLGAEMVHRPVESLSGGERFKTALARILLATPVPQLLVLDEPTNNLDLASAEELVAAIGAYRGGLLVVSHDRRFLERLGVELWLELAPDAEGQLTLREAAP